MKLKNMTILFMVLLLGGCAVALPINERLSYQYEDKAASLKIANIEDISLRWIPEDFPSRIDIQGASGFVGGGSRTRVPTGIALSNRIRNVLDKAIGIDRNSSRVLTITIIDAKSEFSYGFASSELTYGESYLKAKFEFNGKTWEEEFSAKYDTENVAPTYGYRLEHAWDEVSLQVGKSVVNHLSK